MFSVLIKLISMGLGMTVFFGLSKMFNQAYNPDQPVQVYNHVGFLSAGLLLGVLVGPYLEQWSLKIHKQILRSLQNFSPYMLASGFVGLLMGFLFSLIIAIPFWIFMRNFIWLNISITLVTGLVFGYLGVLIFSRVSLWGGGAAVPVAYSPGVAKPKVLDTSVIIDGRIVELLENGFVEGRIVVPDIVLNELQGIADSSDTTRRRRGRRGLEIVSELKDNNNLLVEVVDMPPPKNGESTAVDHRLVSFCKINSAVLVTNDYNLSKIAELRGVKVANLNTLAGSLRRNVAPGEIIEVNVVKYGKEHGQGIAYMDDGAMVVIEKGDKRIGECVSVEIKNIMQSVAGQLIFAAITDEQPADGSGENKKENQ